MAKISGPALGSVFVGSVFLWAGLKGKSIAQAVQYVVQGQSPTTAGQKFPIQQSQVTSAGGAPTPSPAPSSSTPPPGTSGGTFTPAELQTLWTANGGDAGVAQNAVCHAMQESSGRSWVTSSNPDGGTNVGLWQLDTKGVGAGYTVQQLQDPDLNCRLTILATGNGRNWSQWSTPGC